MSNRGKEGKRGAAIELAAGAVRATRSRSGCPVYSLSFVSDFLSGPDRHFRNCPGNDQGVRFQQNPDGLDLLGLFSFLMGCCKLSEVCWGIITAPTRVLTLLMGWWSAFTIITGMAWNLSSMFVIRVLFGLGEAGGFPAATRAIATWFRPQDRGNLQGITHAASRFGAAVAPPVVVFIMLKYGWKSVFYSVREHWLPVGRGLLLLLPGQPQRSFWR